MAKNGVMSWADYFGAGVSTVLIAVSLSVIVYIYLGASGETWAATSLDFVMLSALGINIVGYFCWFFLHVPNSGCFINLGILFFLVLAFLMVGFASLPGTGSRYGNHGTEIFAVIAFINLVFLALLKPPISFMLVPAFIPVFPITVFAAYYYISSPLYRQLKSIDLNSVCIVQMVRAEPIWDQRIKTAVRIKSPSDLELSYFIGEHSPGVYRIDGNKVTVWEYSKRAFGRTYEYKNVPQACKK